MMNCEGIKNVGIVGAGLMGHGLAQIFALKGYPVRVIDNNIAVLEQVPEKVRGNLQVFLDLDLITRSDADECVEKIQLCEDLGDLHQEGSIIIEAISENLDKKKALFSQIEKHVSPETILCSNTSAISITSISEDLRFRERVVGTHFWNPPHILPCVEVIRSKYTSTEVFETVVSFMKKAGKEPVRVLKDVPGFLGNRMQHALWREAISLVEKGIASPEDIDKVVKSSFGLRLAFIGPLETADLAGLDLSLDVEKDLFPHLEKSTEPSPVLISKVDSGETGVKTGKGFHEWDEKKAKDLINKRDATLLKILKETIPRDEM
jgi:3-hydroxybutyryl-CoA dehydrogenase